MEQLVKFISDSISDMTYSSSKGSGPDHATIPSYMACPPEIRADRKVQEARHDYSWSSMPLKDNGICCAGRGGSMLKDKLDELNPCTLSDVELFGSLSSDVDMRGSTSLEDGHWSTAQQTHSNINLTTNHINNKALHHHAKNEHFASSCKTNESQDTNEAHQDVVQQSHVSSSKSPSVLANDIIGPLLLEALDGFLFMVDDKNEIQFISENVTQYLKYTKEDLIGNSIFNLVHVDDHDYFRKALELLMFDPSSKSPSFVCRMLVKQPAKGHQTYDRMQITTTLQPYPFDSKSNQGNPQLVACVARRIGVAKPNISSAEIEQFTTKQDVKGVILDTSGISPDNFSFSNLIGQNIQNFCHVNDKQQLFKHHREVLNSGTNTSGVYRFKLKEDKYVFVQTKSQLFKNPANPKLDFIMSTHSIVRECFDDTELKGSASSSLVKAIMGQTGSKQRMRYQGPNGDHFSDCQAPPYCSYSQPDIMDGCDVNIKGEQMPVHYWRGGRGSSGDYGSMTLPSKPRGRGDRLTTRPVGRPRLHPGGFSSSRLHAQMVKSTELKQQQAAYVPSPRDGCHALYAGHHRPRRRRQSNLPRSNSMTIGDADIFSPCTQPKRIGALLNNSSENICYNPKNSYCTSNNNNNNFGAQQQQQQHQTQRYAQKDYSFDTSTSTDHFAEPAGIGQCVNGEDILAGSDQSLEDLLAGNPDLYNSFLNEVDMFSMDFDESLLEEASTRNSQNNNPDMSNYPLSSDVTNKPLPPSPHVTGPPRQQHRHGHPGCQFPDPLPPSQFTPTSASSSSTAFKQADYKGTIADDHTHLVDLLSYNKNTSNEVKKENLGFKLEERKKERKNSSSNVILKKLLSQEDDEVDGGASAGGCGGAGCLDSNGRVLALLTGTGIGEVFPGGICKQLKKEMENNLSNNNLPQESSIASSRLPASSSTSTAFVGMHSESINSCANKCLHMCDNVSQLSTRSADRTELDEEDKSLSSDCGGSSLACRERQNVLLKELLNETNSGAMNSSVQSKLLKSLLASDESNFYILEEKCSSETNFGLQPVLNQTDSQSGNINNNSSTNGNGPSSNFSVDFDNLTSIQQKMNNNNDMYSDSDDGAIKIEGVLPSISRASLDNRTVYSEKCTVSTPGPVSNENALNLPTLESMKEMTKYDSQRESCFSDNNNIPCDAYPSDHSATFKEHSSANIDGKPSNPCSSIPSPSLVDSCSKFSSCDVTCGTESPLLSFSLGGIDRPDQPKFSASSSSLGERPSRKNVLLAQLLSRTSDDILLPNAPVVTATSMSIFPQRNASSIAVVTPMVHMFKKSKTCTSPSISSQASTCGKELHGDETCCSVDKVHGTCKKVKVENVVTISEKVFPPAKPSVSLQPFRCFPTGHQKLTCSSPPALSIPPSFLPSLSNSPDSIEIFTPKTQLHYSGGSVEHVNDKISSDGMVSVVPCFDSSGIIAEVTRYDKVKNAILADCPPPMQQAIKPSSNNELKSFANKNNCDCDNTMEPLIRIQNSFGTAASFHVDSSVESVKMGMSASHCQTIHKQTTACGPTLFKTESMEAQTRNIQSANVCSTKPFVTQQVQKAQMSQINEEDPFSATYSPISPALQDENSQLEGSVFQNFSTNLHSNTVMGSSSNTIKNSVDAVNNINDIDKFGMPVQNVTEDDAATTCLPLMANINNQQQMLMGNSCSNENSLTPGMDDFTGRMQISRMPMTCPPLNDGQWSDPSGQQFVKVMEKQSGGFVDQPQAMGQLTIERFSRKRVHSDVFIDQQSLIDQQSNWTTNAQLNRNDPQQFSIHQQQQQQMLQQQRHQIYGDSMKGSDSRKYVANMGGYSNFQDPRNQSFQGPDQVYGKIQGPGPGPQSVNFNPMINNSAPPPYQMDRGWTQPRGAVPLIMGVRHKPPYVQTDYSYPMQPDGHCYMGPLMNEKMILTNKHQQTKQYFHAQQYSPQLHHIQPTNQLLPSHQRPMPGHPSHHLHYMKHKNISVASAGLPMDCMPCCDAMNCSSNDTSSFRPNQFDSNNFSPYSKVYHQPHASMYQQHLQQQQFSPLPQQFTSDSLGRKLHRQEFGHNLRNQNSQFQQNFQQKPNYSSMSLQQQMLQQNVNQSPHFGSPSFPSDSPSQSLSSLVDDSLQIHPDSGLLDFPAELDEVPNQVTKQSFPNLHDHSIPFKSNQYLTGTSHSATNQSPFSSNFSQMSTDGLSGNYAEGGRNEAWNDAGSFQSFADIAKNEQDSQLQFGGNKFMANNNSSIKSSINNNNNNSINSTTTSSTKEYLRKELRNICTARSQQQQKSTNNCSLMNSTDDYRETTIGQQQESFLTQGQGSFSCSNSESFNSQSVINAPSHQNKWQPGLGDGMKPVEERKTQELNTDEEKPQDTCIKDDDLFKNITLSFTDVESESFWSPSTDKQTVFDNGDLF